MLAPTQISLDSCIMQQHIPWGHWSSIMILFSVPTTILDHCDKSLPTTHSHTPFTQVAKLPKCVRTQLLHHWWNPESLPFGLGFNSLICVDTFLIISFPLLFRNVEEKLDMHSNLLVKMQLNPFSWAVLISKALYKYLEIQNWIKVSIKTPKSHHLTKI